jgi:hypothetical protein
MVASLGIIGLPLSTEADPAQGTNTQAALSLSPRIFLRLEPTDLRETSLHDRFFDEVTTTDSTVYDRFSGPFSRLSWLRKVDTLGYGSIEKFNQAGAKMFASIGTDSLRDSVADGFPTDLWQDRFEAWLASFIVGTIGNAEEEHFRVTSIVYSDVRSSWETAHRAASIQFGVRPWRSSPYVYVQAQAGHLDGRALLTFEGRAGYTLFGAGRLEGRLTLALPYQFRLGAGVAIDPARIAASTDYTHMAVTLERAIRPTRPSGSSHASTPESLFFIGFRSGLDQSHSTARHETQFLVGFNRLW